MLRSMAVVGAGINGLLAAFFVTEKFSDLHIDIYDAEGHPSSIKDHKRVTYGSRDARHITGSESIGFENSIHKAALRNPPNHDIAGWLLKDEANLTSREKHWRDKFESTYIGSDSLNELDFAHAKLNYEGLTKWNELMVTYPFISSHVLSHDGVDVYFSDEAAFDDDLVMEREFCQRYFKDGVVKTEQNKELSGLYAKKLVVPGLSIRVKSLANDLLTRLEANKNITFHWNNTIENGDKLHEQVIVWTAGVTHNRPTEYEEHYIQGIVGCWVTIPNKGYKHPYKIATPVPSAYINFTPDEDDLHISGGFGWTGEYTGAAHVKRIAMPIAEHFVEQINRYLAANISAEDVIYCVRASTPTGQPLCLTETSHKRVNIFITGSAKSGTTHAPILSEYVLKQLRQFGE